MQNMLLDRDRHAAELAQAVDELVRGRVSKKVWDANDREDVIQEIQIAVLRQLSEIVAADDPPAFVMFIASRKIYLHYRQSSRGSRALVAVNTPAVELVEPTVIPVDLAEQAEDYDLLEAFMATLPAEQRTILDHRFCEELSIRSIAEKLGLTPYLAQTRLDSILTAARAWFQPRTPRAASIARRHDA